LNDVAEYKTALRVLQLATKLVDNDAWSFSLKGWACQMLKQPTEAHQAYSRAIELDPNNRWWQKGLANALDDLRKLEDAAKTYQAVIDQGSQHDEVDAE